ncbi:MAG: hypothetical protein GTO51_05525 [Candidatus Latescibacteria bacterium]|nr:hypothetical protein [Candidatus Latescibacterota bacterium]NIO28464.1 hypothetical protein [Candidatus Latescibacterota bacterium]NIO56013.1 hypothetical protein [Candidatus Latescibacterota bacterium]NIT01977.1 hypothetical protein [Candidatus Latescibacterota bacterium]
MMLTLIRRSSAVSSLPKLLLKGALLCTVFLAIYNLAYLHREMASLTMQVAMVWLVLSLYLAVGKIGERCSRFDMALPISSRKLWLAHSLAAVLSGGLVLAVATGIIEYGIRLLYRLPRPAPVLERNLFDMAPILGAALILTIVLLNSLDLSLSSIPSSKRNRLIKAGVLLGMFGLIIVLGRLSAFSAFIVLFAAFMVAWRSYRVLPVSFSLVPLQPDTDEEPAALAEEQEWIAPTEPTIYGGLRQKSSLTTTIYHCLIKYRSIGLVVFPVLIGWGMLLSGFFSVWRGWEDELRYTLVLLTAYLLFSGIGGQLKKVYLFDHLPISRRLVFAVLCLPYLFAVFLGYGAGRIAVAAIEEPANAITYIADSSCCHIRIPIEFCRISWSGNPPDNTSPWGESHPAWKASLFKEGRSALYSPFDTPENSSPDFVALQISRAVEAIYERSIPPDDIKNRYLDVAPDGSIGMKGVGLTLLENYPDMKRRSNGPVFPVMILLASLALFILISIYLRTFRLSITDSVRKIVFIGLLLLTFVLHLMQYVLAIDDHMKMWVYIGFWKVFIRNLGDLLPGGSITIWVICALLFLIGYRLTEKQFEGIEMPVEK